MDENLMFVLSFLCVATFFWTVVSITDLYAQKVIVPRTKKRFVIPDLEREGFSFLRIERIENKFWHIVNMDKGDFEDGSLASVLENLEKGRPLYLFLYYLDAEKIEQRCTIKIKLYMIGYPYKVEYRPEL